MLNFQDETVLKLLRRTARVWGIMPDYLSAGGEIVHSTPQTLVHLLELLGDRPLERVRDLEAILEEKRLQRFQDVLSPIQVWTSMKPPVAVAYLTPQQLQQDIHFLFEQEDGQKFEQKAVIEKLCIKRAGNHMYHKVLLKFVVPMPIGFHKLRMTLGDGKSYLSHIFCTPSAPQIKDNSSLGWGLFAPLYAVRSAGNGGIGDLQDLIRIQDYTHEQGGEFFGTLPLLSSRDTAEVSRPSPYSPYSRLFWNELFLPLEMLLVESPQYSSLLKDPAYQKSKQDLQTTAILDYPGVEKFKKPILEKLAQEFFNSKQDEEPAYQAFIQRHPLLEAYATDRARGDSLQKKYHLYCQFQMDRFLKSQKERRLANETAGLYLDFPVGCERDGFDGTRFASSFLKQASAGAPPDTMFRHGQNWGFAPMHPLKMREDGYAYFIQCVRHHVKYASILRVDHVMGLHRMYVIPAKHSAREGAYVRYNRRELFAILLIESYRNKVRVIGEDLGTVPATVRDEMRKNNFLGMWLWPFEAGNHPSKSVQRLKTPVLACLNTHDMIPLQGMIEGEDLKIFKDLNIIDHPTFLKEQKDREHQIKNWMHDLKIKAPKDILNKSLRLMAESRARGVLINVEDLWRENMPQNVPGTSIEYNNWNRKMRRTNEEWMKDPKLKKTLRDFSTWRKRAEGKDEQKWELNPR